MAGGRPSKYYSNVEPKLLLVERWARNGLTEEQICDNLDVSVSSWQEYKKEFPELLTALKNGKEVIDTMVENALLKAAMGYEYEEEQMSGPNIGTVKKYAQPNTTALIFWLKNRQPKDWRDKQELEHSGELNFVINRKRMNQDASGDD